MRAPFRLRVTYVVMPSHRQIARLDDACNRQEEYINQLEEYANSVEAINEDLRKEVRTHGAAANRKRQERVCVGKQVEMCGRKKSEHTHKMMSMGGCISPMPAA